MRSDPPTDFDGSGRCFLTENGAGDTDVDGGPTRLISRAFDLSGITDPYLSYARWYMTGDDTMTVEVSSNNGSTWTLVETVGDTQGWEVVTFRVADFVTPSAQTRLRFSVDDEPNNSVTEAAIDALRIVTIDCEPSGSVGTSYCIASVNSTGQGAEIRATGSDVIADNDFTLIAESLPPSTPGLFYFGPNQLQPAR